MTNKNSDSIKIHGTNVKKTYIHSFMVRIKMWILSVHPHSSRYSHLIRYHFVNQNKKFH